MAFLALTTLFRKRGTTSSIVAIALLVAILASMNSTVNHINSQGEALGRIPKTGKAYLILSNNSTSITDSQVDAKLASLVSNAGDVKYVMAQKVFVATLATNFGNHTALVRTVEDVQTFLNVRNSHVNGVVANASEQANIGEVLARLASIDVGDVVTVDNGGGFFKVKVVGIVKTLTQSDAELILPMKAANHLSGEYGKASFIEFAPKNHNLENEVIDRIIELLPPNTKIVKVQQLKTFMQHVNSQTLSFLGMWSSVVYAAVIAASYVLATRLIAESSYDLAMLRALGAKKKQTFKLVITYTATITLLASTLGLAIGISGTQVASTIVGWIWPSIKINPFLEPGQALQILMLTLASSFLGCVYPAFRSARNGYVEQPL